MPLFARPFILILSTFLFSCENEQELQRQSQLENQAIEIQSKNAVLNNINKEIRDQKVTDPTEDLADLTEQIQKAKELAKKTTEKAEALRAEKTQLEKDFADYQERYPIRN